MICKCEFTLGLECSLNFGYIHKRDKELRQKCLSNCIGYTVMNKSKSTFQDHTVIKFVEYFTSSKTAMKLKI